MNLYGFLTLKTKNKDDRPGNEHEVIKNVIGENIKQQYYHKKFVIVFNEMNQVLCIVIIYYLLHWIPYEMQYSLCHQINNIEAS